MILNAEGREFIRWPYTADEDMTGVAVEVFINGAWHPAFAVSSAVAGAAWTGEITLLCAGPDADVPTPGATVVLDLGANPALIRFPDTPELVVRNAGTITVTA